jgi:uncharacterized protein YjbI with pentapeptide repeats
MERRIVDRVLGLTVAACALSAALPAWGDIFRQNGEVIAGTEGMTPEPGINLSFFNTGEHNLQYAELGGANLASANFLESDLTDANFSNATLSIANFSGCLIRGANFSGTTARGFVSSQLYSTATYRSGDLYVKLSNNTMNNWSFAGMSVHGFFDNADLGSANFSNAYVNYVHFDGSNLCDADFTGARFSLGFFPNANLTSANFTGADLREVDFTGAILTNAIITNVNLAGMPLKADQFYSTANYVGGDLSGLMLGADYYERPRRSNMNGWKFLGKTLIGTNLAYADLIGADFRNATLASAILVNANISGGDFSYANLSSASLHGDEGRVVARNAKFRYANLTNTDMFAFSSFGSDVCEGEWQNTDFSNADLTGARPHGCDFTEACFLDAILTGADIGQSNFSRADLRGAIGFAPQIDTTNENAILPNGTIHGLILNAEETLNVRNYPMAITITSGTVINRGGTLRLLLEPDWDSVIQISPGITPSLGGTLDLELGEGVDPAMLMGESFILFDWNCDLELSNRFSLIETPALPSGYSWDLSQLYSTGIVTVIPVPEPGTAVLTAFPIVGLLGCRRRRMKSWRP